MKKADFLWILTLIAIVAFLVLPATHEIFINATKSHPYAMGFLKVAILATMGELLALRIISGAWKKPLGLIYRSIIWGFFGMSFAIVFDIFAGGITFVLGKGLLPTFSGEIASKVGFAIFTSVFLNLIFAPTFMAFHRITDTYIDLGNGKLSSMLKIKLIDVLNKIDWNSFIGFVVIKTIPFFWIPAHTITFLLPPEYRVLMAAMLSIALGGILAFAKRKAVKAV